MAEFPLLDILRNRIISTRISTAASHQLITLLIIARNDSADDKNHHRSRFYVLRFERSSHRANVCEQLTTKVNTVDKERNLYIFVIDFIRV